MADSTSEDDGIAAPGLFGPHMRLVLHFVFAQDTWTPDAKKAFYERISRFDEYCNNPERLETASKALWEDLADNHIWDAEDLQPSNFAAILARYYDGAKRTLKERERMARQRATATNASRRQAKDRSNESAYLEAFGEGKNAGTGSASKSIDPVVAERGVKAPKTIGRDVDAKGAKIRTLNSRTRRGTRKTSTTKAVRTVRVGEDESGNLLLDQGLFGDPSRSFTPIRIRGNKPHRFAGVLEALARGTEAQLNYSDERKLNGWLGRKENGRQPFRLKGETKDSANRQPRPVKVVPAPGVKTQVRLRPAAGFKPA